MTILNILISGAGCAGPSLAYWLIRGGHRVTIVERWPIIRASGAQIDLREEGLQVIKKMGLLSEVRSRAVDEDGISLVNTNGQAVATFMANKSGKGQQSFSSEYEIMRGDLVELLYNATKDHVRYMFGNTVEQFEQHDKQVKVKFADGQTGAYDMLVGADGQGSRIREAILPKSADPLRHLGVFLAHWEIPTTVVPLNNKIAKALHSPRGRVIATRTHSTIYSQAAAWVRQDSPELRRLPRASIEVQKKYWYTMFKDVGWIAPSLVAEMSTTKQFYCYEMVQVHSNVWHQGRVVLVADAAHCPSPLSGMGTTSALAGAYVLAGEISRNPDNLELAFAEYDRKLRPLVNRLQKLPNWLLSVVFPRTQFGISVLHFIAGVLAFLRVPELAARFARDSKSDWKLPDYPEL